MQRLHKFASIALLVLAGGFLALVSFALTPNAYTCIGYCDDSGRFSFIHETKPKK